MDPCSRCGDTGATAYSQAAGAVLCERCYCALPEARYRPPVGAVVRLPRPKPYQPDEYERLVRDVWAWMEADGYCLSMGTSPPVLVGRCPRCAQPMAARFLHRPLAEVRLACDGDCGEAAIAAALGHSGG